jgi:hypothetical protein
MALNPRGLGMAYTTGFPFAGSGDAIPEETPGAKFTVAGVARQLGVAPGTLRTWDRRYGIGPSQHSAGNHRKYSDLDLARLMFMHKLIVSGVGPAEAAQTALQMRSPLKTETADTPVAAGLTNPDNTAVPSINRSSVVDALYRTAHTLNRQALDEMIRSELENFGVLQTWETLLVPLLVMIGDDWARTGAFIEVERMVSEIIRSRLAAHSFVPKPINPNPVLLACIGEETHSLAITALAASLADHNVQVQFLGARTPIVAICEVVKRSAPPAIFIWAQLEQNADTSILSALPNTRPAPRVILGGPGWSEPSYFGARIATDFMSAQQEIMSAVGIDQIGIDR